MVMLFPSRESSIGAPEPPGNFKDNYQHLKKLINKALKEGTPLEDLRLVPKDSDKGSQKKLSKNDLIKLLHTLRKLRSKYQRLLQPPVPKELIRDILAKPEQDRLPWETEALEKQEKWKEDLKSMRAQVQKELNDHLNDEFFSGL
jgi:hypothetical protein